MAPLCSAVFTAALLSLSLAAGVPVPDVPDIPPGAPESYTVAAAAPGWGQGVDQLARRLVGQMEPLLERVLSARCPTDELAGLQARLAALEREMAELRRAAPTQPPPEPDQPPEVEPESGLKPTLLPAPEPEVEPESGLKPTLLPAPEPEPEPECESEPEPLAADLAPFEWPNKLACVRSCLQLRDQYRRQHHLRMPQDGAYWFTGMTVPTLCDFSHDGGGWTLLLTARSRDGWNLLSVLGRRERSPSLEDNYSILGRADAIRDLSTSDRFAYRIETQAESGRQRWGGVWFAPRNYSFVHETPDQTEVFIVKRFDKWTYKTTGVRRRMPWLNMHVRGGGNGPSVLTTAEASGNGWGTLLYDEGTTSYQHSPWIHPEAVQSGTVLYWMRERAR